MKWLYYLKTYKQKYLRLLSITNGTGCITYAILILLQYGQNRDW